ncbi:MAG: cyanoexosortase B, partial [Cyanobacteria bacterium J083]
MHLQNKLFPTQEKNLFYIIVFALLAVLYAPVIFHWVDGWLEKN